MPDIGSQEQVLLAVILVVPGIISMKVFGLVQPGRHVTAARDLFEALAYGVANAALWFVPVSLWVLPSAATRPVKTWLVAVGALLISPVLLALIARWFLRRKWLRRWIPHPTPTSWDLVFQQRQPVWIRITREVGSRIGGYLGTGSFASCYPEPRDLYIEQTWVLDDEGKFMKPVDRSKGALLLVQDGDIVELLSDEPVEGKQ